MSEHLGYAADPQLTPITIDPAKAPEDATFELFRGGLGDAAITIVRAARGEQMSDLQYKAAIYIVERIMGKPKLQSDAMDQELKTLVSDIRKGA